MTFAGCIPKGSHVHILMHVPLGAAWTYWRSRRWLERVTGRPYRKGVIHTSRIAGAVRAHVIAPERYLANLSVVVAYIVKGAAAGAATALELKRSQEGGRIVGKRVGWSQSLSRAVIEPLNARFPDGGLQTIIPLSGCSTNVAT